MTESPSLRINLAGTWFDLSADDPRMLPLLARLWEPFVAADARGDLTPVRFFTRDEPMPSFQVADDDPSHGTDLWVTMFGARLQMVQRAIKRLEGDRVYLHSAVLERNGTGTLLIGPYESGKTTFSIELLKRGWRLLSDDVALIDPASLAVEWFPKPLGIKRGNWADYEHFWDPQPDWIPPPTGAFLIPATAFELSHVVESIEAMVFLKYDGGAPSAVEELSPARAVVLASECSGGTSLESVRTLGALAERARHIFQLTHGGGGDAIAQLLRLLDPE